MQAQIMPMQISRLDHFWTSEYPQVAFSSVWENETRDCRRRMLTIVTLWHVSVLLSGSRVGGRGVDASHKVPTTNIRPTPTFFFQGSFSLCSWLSGIASIQMSTTILIIAFDHAIAVILTQEPLCSASHLVQL